MISFDLFLQQLLSGLVVGSSYVLMAAGFSLIWGIMSVLNLAHGEFFMLGAYSTFYLATLLGLNPIISCLISMVILFVLGILFQQVLVRPLVGRQGWQIDTVLITIGASIFLQNFALIVFGKDYKGLPPLYEETFNIGPVFLAYDRLLVLAVGICLIIFLWFFIKYTKTGMAIRAVSENLQSAYLAGINIKKIFMICFGLSAAFAGAAGALLAPVFFIFPTVGAGPLLMAFAVVIFGGLGSINGAIYAGFLVGVVESMLVMFTTSAWKDAGVFALVILVLAIKPKGLFGIKAE